MDFCPMCKTLLVPGLWKGKNVGKCSCGFIRTGGISLEGEEKSSNILTGSGIASEDVNTGWDFLCGKCGHNKADAKELGEILGNEKSVTLFTCLNCGNVERK